MAAIARDCPGDDMPRRRIALLCLAGIALMWPAPARSHEKTRSGSIDVTVGWGEEPAFSGARNFVEVDLADAHGAPVTDDTGSLAVELSFGGERVTRPLVPAERGKFRAWLVPTRPGTYTFHVTGRLRGK